MVKDERGLTLIEVLAAVAILSIVVIAFTNISNYSLLARIKSDTSVEALRIAEQELNTIRYNKPSSVEIANDPIVTVGQYSVIREVDALGDLTETNYERANYLDKHISLQGIIPIDNIPQIVTVTVTWSD